MALGIRVFRFVRCPPLSLTPGLVRGFTGVTSGSGNSWRKIAEGCWGASRLWRELGGRVREIGGAIRGQTEVLGRFRAELEDRLRGERVSLGKEHSEAVRGIESKAGEFYRGGLEGSGKRAREAARSAGLLLDSYRRPDEFYSLKYSMLEERLEQVREIDGELAYEKMRRAVEKASQEKARQVERARLEWARQETARQSRERRGPERGGGGAGLWPQPLVWSCSGGVRG